MFSSMLAGLVGLAIMVVIFLVARKFFLWYWMIDQIAADLAAIRAALEKK
jgi:hypothetical protein